MGHWALGQQIQRQEESLLIQKTKGSNSSLEISLRITIQLMPAQVLPNLLTLEK